VAGWAGLYTLRGAHPTLPGGVHGHPGADSAPATPDRSAAGRGRPRITDDDAVASWLAIQPGLTPHGLRHGHQTWMEELGTPYILVADRMGHEVPGMRGTYGHVSDGMRATLREALQALWEQALTDPAASLAALDSAGPGRASPGASSNLSRDRCSHSAPKIGHQKITAVLRTRVRRP
jgi:hypothetical protein